MTATRKTDRRRAGTWSKRNACTTRHPDRRRAIADELEHAAAQVTP